MKTIEIEPIMEIFPLSNENKKIVNQLYSSGEWLKPKLGRTENGYDVIVMIRRGVKIKN